MQSPVSLQPGVYLCNIVHQINTSSMECNHLLVSACWLSASFRPRNHNTLSYISSVFQYILSGFLTNILRFSKYILRFLKYILRFQYIFSGFRHILRFQYIFSDFNIYSQVSTYNPNSNEVGTLC